MQLQIDYPKHWQKGQLLDVRKYTDGKFTISLYGEDASCEEQLEFHSAEEAQKFVSWWYAHETEVW